MPASFVEGFLNNVDQQAQIRNDISVVARNYFINRTPVVARVSRVPVGSTTFSVVNRVFRTRAAVLGAALSDTTGTLLTLVDASPFMIGDVLELASGERVQLVTDPNLAANTAQMIRGVEGTTAATQTNTTAVTLIGNSRTGAEVNQTGVAAKPSGTPQYTQTFQHPVQVGGSLQATTSFVSAPGQSTPFDQYKMDALQNLMDDMEYSSYYGKGEDPATNGRAKQKGMRTQISNLVTSPTNAGAYKAVDFIRDIAAPARRNGGKVDVILCSPEFMVGFASWGAAVQRIDAGRNVFGTPIDTFSVPFMGGIAILEAPLLKPFTAVGLTSSEVKMRVKRNEFWNPRASRGDAIEGDYIAELAIEVGNPGMHTWVEGITTFSAT